MDLSCYKTQTLERLSTDELIDLAEKKGLDIPPGLERVFIIEEILYLDLYGIARTGKADEHKTYPKQHNVSMIEVIVRDPLWAFIFWEIKGQDKELYENAAEFEGYCLRVIPFKPDNGQPDLASSFTVAVGTEDSSWYIGFPPDIGCLFKVELCVLQQANCVVIAASLPFKMPHLIDSRRDSSGEIQMIYKNPLTQLSGIEHFSLLRSLDRQLRPRGK